MSPAIRSNKPPRVELPRQVEVGGVVHKEGEVGQEGRVNWEGEALHLGHCHGPVEEGGLFHCYTTHSICQTYIL